MPATATQSDRATSEFLADLERQHRRSATRTPSTRSKRTNFFDFGRQIRASQSGGFAGGKLDRLTEEWTPGTIGPNRAHQMDGQRLRERARDLFDNNPFAASAIDAYISNVIECGILPERDDAWEREWNRWGGLTPHATTDCDLTRDGTIYDVMRLWLTEMLVAGGCLLHFVDLPRKSQRIPLALELIPEERFADSLTSFGSNSKTANRVFRGIEYDPASGRKVAFHLRKNQPNDLPEDPFGTIRLSAEHCRYAYTKQRIGAQRGTTLLKQVIIYLWALGYYTDNELFASNIKSSWAYMIKTSTDATPDFDWQGLFDSSPETGTVDIHGNKIEKHEGGMIFRGAPGDEITPVGPNVPQSESLPWIKMIENSIAIGTRLSFYAVIRDYSDITLGTARVIKNEDKKRYRPMQEFTIAHFGNPTVDRFDRAAVGAMLPGFPSPAEYVSERDELFEQHEWQPPGWESPNPKDDATADDIRLKSRTDSHKDVLGRMGKSWRKVRVQIAEEMAEMREDGTLPAAETSAAVLPDNQNTFENEDEL